MVFKKIIFQNRYVELETLPPFMEKKHLKFPFWLFASLPKSYSPGFWHRLWSSNRRKQKPEKLRKFWPQQHFFGPQFVRPPKTPLVLQPWLPLAILRTGGIVTVITNKSSSESIMLCWTEHKLVRELSAITAGFARKAIMVPREHMFKSAKKSKIYIVN